MTFSFKTVNFIPKGRKIKVVISYETAEIRSDLDADKYLSIDFGMNNLCACISEDGCFLINGRPLKSINQIYNKKSSEFKERQARIIFKRKSLKQDIQFIQIIEKI